MREDHERHKTFVAKMIAEGRVGFGAMSDADLARRIETAREKDHWGECVRMRGPTWSEREEGTLAVAEDGSSYHSHVKTREDFGCVMFEEKG